MKKICLVVSSVMTAKVFLLDQIAALSCIYQVYVIANTDDTNFLRDKGIEVEVLSAPIERKIAPFQDLYALVRLFRLFRKYRFDVVHSVSPKAGLLSMVAGALACIPVRIHTFTGQVWATRTGAARWVFKQADRIIAACATHVLVDSPSQRAFIVREGILAASKAAVLGRGSICGVDSSRFYPDETTREALRAQLGVGEATLFLYLGRLNRDKGVNDLAQAFSALTRERQDVFLLLVGPDEEGLKSQLLECLSPWKERVWFVDYTPEPERYMTAADVLCLPSYREGFGQVIIEAAACGVPAIASRIYGVVDAVEDQETGQLFCPGDSDALADCMRRLASNLPLRQALGEAARRRAVAEFSQERITDLVVAFYRELTQETVSA